MNTIITNICDFLIFCLSMLIAIVPAECSPPCIVQDNNTVSALEVFWINLNQSSSRRKATENMLAYHIGGKGHRISAMTPELVYIPPLLSKAFHCASLSDSQAEEEKNNMIKASKGRESAYRILVRGHCGRYRNTRRELAVTISHLKTLRTAVDDSFRSPYIKYALILEDDMTFPFDIDFRALITSAPKDFGMLQLITSNMRDIESLWTEYKHKGILWTKREITSREQDFWCAGAYIVNIEMLKPVLDTIIQPIDDEVMEVKVIAGYGATKKLPCSPRRCCRNGTFREIPPCIHARRGYQADHFIFNLLRGKTYMLNVPIVTGTSAGNISTLHQKHVSSHHIAAFNKINGYVAIMKTGSVPTPLFIRANYCSFEEYQALKYSVNIDGSHTFFRKISQHLLSLLKYIINLGY